MASLASSPHALTTLHPGRRARRREALRVVKGLLFISPWLIGFLWLTLYPAVASLYYSFTRFNMITPPRWIGLGNYAKMFLEDDVFRVALLNTLYFAGFGVPVQTVIGVALALLLNAKVRGMSIYRTVYYLPTVIPVVAGSFLWLWILHPKMGLVNVLLEMVGIRGPGWLSDPAWSKPALIILSAWGLGQAVVIYLAALQDIPVRLYEAAELDGANRAQSLFLITLPLLTPSIFFNVVMGIIGSFQYFTSAFVMTGGGPLRSTLFYGLQLYYVGFQDFKMGYASAMAWVLLLMILVITLLFFRSSGRWVHYGRQ